MRVAIVGSRDWPEPERVRAFVAELAKRYPNATVISGGARGVDQEAEQAARLCALEVVSYRYRDACFWRNRERLGRAGVFAWGNNPRRAELKGRVCIVVVPRAKMGSVLVEFTDTGERVVTSYRAIRDATPAQALLARNSLIVRDAERVVAFHDAPPWRGSIAGTAGTRDTIAKSINLGLPVTRYLPGTKAPERYSEADFLGELRRLGAREI